METDVVLAGSVDQHRSPDNVGLDERCRVKERVVVVAFCRVVDDRVGVLDQGINQVDVADVAND